MRKDVYELAEQMADKYFGGNFSAYITYLVCADHYGLSRVKDDEESKAKKEEVKESVNKYVKNEENERYIDQFLNMGVN